MICNKCGTDNPDRSNFCIRCGNRLSPPAQPQTPNTFIPPSPPPPPPQQQQSESPFGGKKISDRHYTLEDIARQQAESNNEIGLASAPPERRHKKRKRPRESFLPHSNSGNTDEQDSNDLYTNTPSGRINLEKPRIQDKNAVNPLLPSMDELRSLHDGKPQSGTYSELPVEPSTVSSLLSALQQNTDGAADAEQTEKQTEKASQQENIPDSEPSAQQEPAPAPEPEQIHGRGLASYRYTISTAPVPLKGQMQSTLPLFSGSLKAQAEALRQDYFNRKSNNSK